MGRRVVSGDCHPAERKNGDFEVATHLLVDRPLLDDGLFVDQSKMIYSMDLRSFYHESFNNFSKTLRLRVKLELLEISIMEVRFSSISSSS
ncbi:unnamed protein product [Spirodela intermedia]|uniref:Uncharacterized protein n=1 Tax=Spirodela intermedia TaxID=51605 RepID=A0A7I8KS35_SPIIN|nr:unnamed protein product [Spirodela intermedia]